MYLKSAENVDMLVQIVNSRGMDNGYIGCTKMRKLFFIKKNCQDSVVSFNLY